MLDPDHATRAVPSHAPAPGAGGGFDSPHALQILTTEHWSLLASRQLGYTEAMSRAAIFVAALTGSVVALALVSQATDFGDEFVAFALVLLPVVFFLGVVTIARLGQINFEDSVWVQGMNRIRHAYLELAPELEPYFVTSKHDDDPGVLASLSMPGIVPRRQAFIAVPGVVAVLDAVVAGAIAAIAGLGLELGTAASIALGIAAFAVTLGAFGVWAVRTIMRYRATMVVRFPSTLAGEGVD
jgi:hypothetical protein